MLRRAQRYTVNEHALAPVFQPPAFVFQQADLTTTDWPKAIAGQLFDWVLAFAVFHHLPGYELRAAVLSKLAQHLAPGGRIALSNWQLTRGERHPQRLEPWSTAGLRTDDLEPGDYLLSWERKGRHGLRYVHELSPDEMGRLAAGAGREISGTFAADGVSGDLSEYIVAQMRP